jgi:hypothetical protein
MVVEHRDMSGSIKPIDQVRTLIHTIRGQRIVLDVDLASVYGTTTKRLNEQVRRNIERFPGEFMFQLSDQEVTDLRSQIATANLSMRRANPYAFTEHGALMAANIVNSPLAIQSSIALVKAFIEARRILGELAELKRRQSDIERRMFSGFTGLEQELQEIRFLISALQEPEVKKKGKLGF